MTYRELLLENARLRTELAETKNAAQELIDKQRTRAERAEANFREQTLEAMRIDLARQKAESRVAELKRWRCPEPSEHTKETWSPESEVSEEARDEAWERIRLHYVDKKAREGEDER